MTSTMPTILILLTGLSASCVKAANHTQNKTTEIVVAEWNFSDYSTNITITLFLLAMIFIKMAFHRIPYVVDYVPESFVLILIGIIFGTIIRYGVRVGSLEQTTWMLTPSLFFDYLLPPIVLESSYSLYNRTFSEYLGVVLLFAIVGTVLNFLIIGFLMYGILMAGVFGGMTERFDLKGLLLFSSLIVAVDPVAVLAIFQDIGVELSLYYIVFGESLLNDGITVVLYDIMTAFTDREMVTARDIGLGIASFFTVSFGGLFIGICIGIISCLISRIPSRLSAFTLILLAYISYVISDCIGWSGIISMIGCGLLQAAYAFNNLDHDSVIMVHKLMKVISELSESVIFLYLGLEVHGSSLEWHTGFILWAMVACLVSRTLVIFGLTAAVNLVQIDRKPITWSEQFILIYGGLRGAVAFSLAVLIEPYKLGDYGEYSRRVIITATLFIILFTVGVMGLTMKPLVKMLKIRTQKKQKLSLFKVLINHVIDETLTGIEELTNSRGRNMIRDMFIRWDEKYVRRILQNHAGGYDYTIVDVYEKIALELHYAAMDPSKMNEILDNIPDRLKYTYLTKFQPTEGSFRRRSPALTLTDSGETVHGQPTEIDLGKFAKSMRSTKKARIMPFDRRHENYLDAIGDIMKAHTRLVRQRLKDRHASYDTTVARSSANVEFLPINEQAKEPRVDSMVV